MAPLNWATYLERAVGKGHPTLADVINRPLRDMLSASGVDPDADFSGILGPVFNVRAYASGATIHDGTTNATPARDAATAAAVAAGGGLVYYGAGQFNHTTAPAILSGTNGVIYQGAGRNVTHIALGANGLSLFNLNGAVRVCLRDMWVGSFSARPTGTGLFVDSSGPVSSEVMLDRVTFQNLPTPFNLGNLQQSAFRDVRYVQSIASATVGVVFYLVKGVSIRIRDFYALTTGGTLPSDIVRLDSSCDSVALDGCEVLGGSGNTASKGFRFMNSLGGGETGPRLIRLNDCYAEDCGQGGFSVEAARDVRIRGGHASVCGLSGYAITGGDSICLSDGLALQNQQHGVYVTGGTGVKVEGMTCSNNSQQTHNTYDGIRIENNVTHARVVANRSGDFIFSLANKQRYGLSIGATSTDYIVAQANDLQGNQTAGLGNFSAGANNQIGNNAGTA